MKHEITVDARWLEPPEPLEKVMLALDALRPGQHVRFLIHREPLPLYGILENMGYTHHTHQLPDHTYAIVIEPRG
ncbi:MAG: DUF2249 domain-containing protein [Betaproteobacteria bacterium]|nr:DUF2249 domain-containing protein [Betaproteobacteria bacterium]